MSEDVLTWALDRAFSSNLIADNIDILWHAGEPLVAGLDFYRKAVQRVESLRSDSTQVSQCIQTNGTLINTTWCDLFKSGGFQVGVSLDGPETIHDTHRRTRSGRGTFRDTMRGIDALRASNIDFSVLAVLTRESLRSIDSVLDFFEAENIRNVAFNLEEIEGVHLDWSFDAEDNPEELYRHFVQRALERHSQGTLVIREISAIERRLGRRPTTIVGPLKPLQFVTVDVGGDFSTFCPELHGYRYPSERQHIFGNVIVNAFTDIFSDPHFLSLYDEIMGGVALCSSSCSRFSICGSHRVGNKYFENRTFLSSETVHCRTRIKLVADAIESCKAVSRQ